MTRFEAVDETVFRRYARVWQPQTRYVDRNYLHRQILPRFGGMYVADIVRADVVRWFATRRATLVAADRSPPILSVILKEAERLGYRMASHAVMNGVPVPLVSRLLGHTNVQMTLHYTHLADRDLGAAAERVGVAMARGAALE